MRAALSLLVVLFLLSLSLVSEGEGHALIMESSPKAEEVLTTSPSRLVIRFNSRIVHALSRVTLLGTDRGQISMHADAGDPPPDPDRLVIRLPPLTPGTYVVQWRVFSVDGHITRGSFSFAIRPLESFR